MGTTTPTAIRRLAALAVSGLLGAGTAGLATLPPAHAAAPLVPSVNTPRKVDEPGKTQDVVRWRTPLPAGVTMTVAVGNDPNALAQVAAGDVTDCSVTVGKRTTTYACAKVDSAEFARVTATKDGASVAFPLMQFNSARGLLRLTAGHFPTKVDRPGYLADQIRVPAVKGIAWKLNGAAVGPGLVPLPAPSAAEITAGTKPVEIEAELAFPDDYSFAEGSLGPEWSLLFDVSVKPATLTAPVAYDVGGRASDGVIIKGGSANVTWTVDGRKASARATDVTVSARRKGEVVVKATPRPGFELPATIAAPSGLDTTAPGTLSCGNATLAGGAASWTCAFTDTAQTIGASSLTDPVFGDVEAGGKDDTITLTGTTGVRWAVNVEGGVARTYSVAHGKKLVVKTAVKTAPTADGTYQVTVTPVAANGDYAIDAAVTPYSQEFANTLVASDITGTSVARVGTTNRMTITGNASVLRWTIKDGAKARSVTVAPGQTIGTVTSGTTGITVTPVFRYGYTAPDGVTVPYTPFAP